MFYVLYLMMSYNSTLYISFIYFGVDLHWSRKSCTL